MTLTMYDSIEVSEIPTPAKAVAGYVGGNWPTYVDLVKRFPHADHLSIAVNASEEATCLDIEPGDSTVQDAPAWYHRQKARGITRPCFYTSLSNVNNLLQTLARAGVSRHEYRVWSAHYTDHPHICGPSEGIGTYADGSQWTEHALGRNLDQSLCEDSFFAGTVTPPSSYVPADEARWEKQWDGLKGNKALWAHLRRLVLLRVMLHRQRQIVQVAEDSGWLTENRHRRYELLFERTQKR